MLISFHRRHRRKHVRRLEIIAVERHVRRVDRLSGCDTTRSDWSGQLVDVELILLSLGIDDRRLGHQTSRLSTNERNLSLKDLVLQLLQLLQLIQFDLLFEERLRRECIGAGA
jgi:hypothetical protein